MSLLPSIPNLPVDQKKGINLRKQIAMQGKGEPDIPEVNQGVGGYLASSLDKD